MSTPRTQLLALSLAALLGCAPPVTAPDIAVGSKSFNESVILGEVLAQVARENGADVTARLRVGGTRAAWDALVSGDIDIYVEYTGTLLRELLADTGVEDDAGLPGVLAQRGLSMSRPLGFNNSYALGMRDEVADARDIRTISDLRSHPDLVVRVSTDFFNSTDGWAALRARYDLPFDDVSYVPHSEVYAPLSQDEIQVTDIYSTDAQIESLGLRTLEDDLGHFPAYHAVLLYRSELATTAPAIIQAWPQLEGYLTADEMVSMNAQVALRHRDPAEVAAALVARVTGQ